MPPSITDQQLAEEIRQTNKSLAEAVAALRAEGASLRESLTAVSGDFKAELAKIRGELKEEAGRINTEIGKITTSLAWMEKLTRAVVGFTGVSLIGLCGLWYQAGQWNGRMETAVASLQKNNEEIKTDLKARDKSSSDAIEGLRKSHDEVRIVVKGLGSDVTGVRSALDHLNENISRLPLRPR